MLGLGTVTPFPPTGYCIIRELDHFPSDHLVLPLQWHNTSGKPILVRNVYLDVKKLNSDDNEVDSIGMFTMAGEYPAISTGSFQDEHEIKNAFTVAPHSISSRIQLFHISDFWDRESENFEFRFHGGEKYRVYIGFERNMDEQPETFLFDMPYHSSVDWLSRDSDWWWDYWTLEY